MDLLSCAKYLLLPCSGRSRWLLFVNSGLKEPRGRWKLHDALNQNHLQMDNLHSRRPCQLQDWLVGTVKPGIGGCMNGIEEEYEQWHASQAFLQAAVRAVIPDNQKSWRAPRLTGWHLEWSQEQMDKAPPGLESTWMASGSFLQWVYRWRVWRDLRSNKDDCVLASCRDVIQNNMDSLMYRDRILQPIVRPYSNILATIPFFKIISVNIFLKWANINRMEWSAEFLDMVPIEHAWDKLCSESTPKFLDDIWRAAVSRMEQNRSSSVTLWKAYCSVKACSNARDRIMPMFLVLFCFSFEF